MAGRWKWWGPTILARTPPASLSSATGALLATRPALAAPIETLGAKPFAEAGFGIGNILNVLRFDATWRLTYKTANNFYVTGTLAISF